MIVPPTKPIRDEIWSKVVREGRLTDAYRDHVQDAINEYRLDLIQFRTSPETKTRIKQALGAISNTESLLTALLADPGYHWAGLATDGPAPNPRALEQASAALAAIRGELESASERLNIRNWQMPKSFLSPERQSTPLTNLITKLLNIQAHCLRQAPPTRPG